MRRSTACVGRIAIPVLFLVLSGCAGNDFVDRQERPVWPVLEDGRELGIRVQEVWSTRNGPGFGYISGMAEWPDGTVWLADMEAAEVWEILPDGKIACCVLSGGFPGDVAYLAALSGGGAVVMGMGTRQASFFGADKKPGHDADIPDIWTRGVATAPGGGFIVSGGFRGAEAAGYAVHRFDQAGRHIGSLHPAVQHQDPHAVRRLSGGPVSVTEAGDLLVSDAAPFRITRYPDMQGDPVPIVEDHAVVPPSELDRALVPEDPRITYSPRWNRSVYVGEMEDGHILNVVHIYPESIRSRTESLWVALTPSGEVAALTRFATGYFVWNKTADGHGVAPVSWTLPS